MVKTRSETERDRIQERRDVQDRQREAHGAHDRRYEAPEGAHDYRREAHGAHDRQREDELRPKLPALAPRSEELLARLPYEDRRPARSPTRSMPSPRRALTTSRPPERSPTRTIIPLLQDVPPSLSRSTSYRSVDSLSEVSERRRKLLEELEIKEEMATMRMKEAQAAAEMLQVRVRKMKLQAQIREEEEEELKAAQDEALAPERVDKWLKQQVEVSRPLQKTEKREEDARDKFGPARRQGVHDIMAHGQREFGNPPARQVAPTVDVPTLAAALSQVMGRREAPRYELPIFTGKSNEWLSFKAAFEETKTCYSPTENVARLRRCLRGGAAEAVSSLIISQPDPWVIMAALERRFGRPEALIIAEMEKLRAMPKTSDNPRDICLFAGRVANAVATVEALKKPQYLYNPEMARLIIDKLTPILRYNWFHYGAGKKNEDIPELKKLAAFLNDEADRCGPYAPPEDQEDGPGKGIFKKKKAERTFTTTVHVKKMNNEEKCPLCEPKNHYLQECFKFLCADVPTRWELCKKSKFCFRCLKSQHRRFTCKAKLCDVQGCGMKHHHMLHFKGKPEEAAKPEVMTTTIEHPVMTAGIKNRRAFLKIVPVTVTGQHTSVNTYALLDEGSTITIIDASIADVLGTDGPTETMWVQGVSGPEIKHEKSKIVSFKIRGKHADRQYELQGARTVERLNFTSQSVNEDEIEDCKHLEDIKDELTYDSASPKLLIGQDNWDLIVSRAIRCGRRDQPVASLTQLGWVLHGCRTSTSEPVAFCGHLIAAERSDPMEELMKKYFDLESLGIEAKKQRSDPEKRALDLLEERSRRLPDGRFETGLLWKEDDMKIPNNHEDALKRLKSLEKKLDKDEDFKKKYEERISNLLDSGYAEKVAAPPTEDKTWYLPHFAVINPEKPKIRVVHDAAARSHGRSLNDMLLPGPDLLQSLPGVVMRFRQYPYALSADIKEMFMQVKIREEDRDALRFLWRGDRREGAPEEYRMTSVIFGATSSPCTALFVKNKNAGEYKDEYPEAARAIEKNHYMDDYIQSFPTPEEARRVAREVDYVHRQAGFELRGWASNDDEIACSFEPSPGAATIHIGGSETEKTLGLLWNTKEDCIGFRVNTRRTPPEVIEGWRPPTKREALSIIMSLFDPLGLVSPVTTPAKKIMQDTWRYGTSWDDPIPDELQPRWQAWMTSLRALEALRIPRCYDYDPPATYELHTFVDASEEAYASAVYWRVTRADGTIHVALAAGKSRVTPLKPISVPRLELQAAVLGARLAKTVEQEHDYEIQSKTYWSDSRTALAWIRAEPRAFKTFVAHRLAEIEDHTKKKEWRWLPSKDNVADDATRSTPLNFSAEHRWFTGPAFLRETSDQWPREEKVEVKDTGEEREKCYVMRDEPAGHPHLPDVRRFSKWLRLIRATGRVLQFVEKCKHKKQQITAARRKRTHENPSTQPDWTKTRTTKKTPAVGRPRELETARYADLEAYHLIAAEKLWLRAAQEDSFPRELNRIRKGQEPAGEDRLASLSAALDSDNVLRVKSRITEAEDINDEMASPAILDGRHPYTKLYVQHVHEKLHHGGTELVVNELRQRLWINRIRPTVKEAIKSCPICRLRRAKPTSPPTGDLPAARLAHHARPFTFTGVDYFGPVEVTVGRHREKRYVALFTCMTMRAVHLEVAASLSADSAVAALRRFIARRGCPTEIWSDNATCFKAADKELREAALEAMEHDATNRHIQWRFIPPAAPFMGGAWERMVRTVKEALRATLHEKYPSDETLSTLLAEVEHTVNSRPLTHVAVSPGEPIALTPNLLLLGPNCHVPAPGAFTPGDLTARQHWKRAQRLADIFWQRWVREYLPLLQHRREPHGRGPAPKVGDLVIVCDPNLPRNTWPRGRVVRILPGRDNEVRVVDIITRGGNVLRRPTKKIVVLPTGSPESDGGRCVHDDSKKT
jgi:hypothetical protein